MSMYGCRLHAIYKEPIMQYNEKRGCRRHFDITSSQVGADFSEEE